MVQTAPPDEGDDAEIDPLVTQAAHFIAHSFSLGKL